MGAQSSTGKAYISSEVVNTPGTMSLNSGYLSGNFREADFWPTRKDCTFPDTPYGSQPRFRLDRRLGHGTARMEPVS